LGGGNAASGPFPTTASLCLAGLFFPLLQRLESSESLFRDAPSGLLSGHAAPDVAGLQLTVGNPDQHGIRADSESLA
jgi:hypothetical protein